MRRKQRLGLSWLLLLPLAGLPIAVFLAWKEPVPPPPRPVIRDSRSGSPETANADTMPPGETTVESVTPAVDSATLAEVPSAAPQQIAVTAPDSPPPKPEVPAGTGNDTPRQPATPPAPGLDWAEIASRPGRWPAQTRMKAPVDFPISVDGKRSGSTRVPAGTSVKVVKIAEDGVDVAYAEYSAKVALDQTTLAEQISAPPSESQPVVPAAQPSPKPAQPAQAAAPVKKDESLLIPQQNWRKPPGDDRASLIELLKVLEHDAQADSSLQVTEHPEITKGVKLMMPLREALVQLGLSKDLIPSKIPMAHPGIPLFYRSFPSKYSLIGDPEDYFNLIYIITDADDRVVGIQFVCENPRSSTMTLPKVDFLTYNYVLNRRKAATTLKVGCVVSDSSEDVLLLESWLFDVRRDKCLEVVRLYLPKRIADFIRHVTEVRLGLVE
ncbi:MAG: hypothetical protein NTV93_15380 [Verrucomicrobia bacterium]|nr:hypothetical protein [Verrucomicrobiota bacterium]